FLREREGAKFVRELWHGTRALDMTPELDTAFDAWVRARAAGRAGAELAARANAREAALALPIMRGVGTCEPAIAARDGIRHGFGSRAVDASRRAGRSARGGARC